VASSSASLHEPPDRLQPSTVDRHRALVSLQEELEAVDWYAQRAEGTSDRELASILVHNGNEEKEHAMMLLEWLRRKDPVLDGHMRTYLFSEAPIVGIEARAEGDGEGAGSGEGGGPATILGSLGIGSLRDA
jgi:ferritin-like protein